MAVPPLRELIAAEVRAWMGRQQVTGEALAAGLGTSGTFVSRRLRGRTSFNVDELDAIAVLLGVPVGDLVEPALRELDRRRAAAARPLRSVDAVDGAAPETTTERRRVPNAEKPSFFSKPAQPTIGPWPAERGTTGPGHPMERRPAA